jgi:hypothetical protein|tara:strand:+ start:4253 stop:4699 length:447 start_codon:yes stop_codon:yes gene_type:complete
LCAEKVDAAPLSEREIHFQLFLGELFPFLKCGANTNMAQTESTQTGNTILLFKEGKIDADYRTNVHEEFAVANDYLSETHAYDSKIIHYCYKGQPTDVCILKDGMPMMVELKVDSASMKSGNIAFPHYNITYANPFVCGESLNESLKA